MPIYTDPPPPGPIETELRAIADLRERFRVKALRLKERIDALTYPVTYTLDGWRIQVGVTPLVVAKLLPDGGTNWGIRFRQVSARIVGGPVFNDCDPVHQIVNPPVKVPNGTFQQVTQGKVTFDRANFTEDLLAALQRMLLESVLADARKKGFIQ